MNILNKKYKELQKRKAEYIYLLSKFAKSWQQPFDAVQMFSKSLYELHCIAGCKLAIYEFTLNKPYKLKFNLN